MLQRFLSIFSRRPKPDGITWVNSAGQTVADAKKLLASKEVQDFIRDNHPIVEERIREELARQRQERKGR